MFNWNASDAYQYLEPFNFVDCSITWSCLVVQGFVIMQDSQSVKLATLVEGDPLAPFSIAATPRCRRGRYSIPWIAPLYPWSLPYIAEC